MKETKRALRRYQQWVVFKRRLKLYGVWYNTTHGDYPYGVRATRDEALRGEAYCYLKDTSTPCSCPMCSYPKYERPQKQYLQKEIVEEIKTFEESLDI